MSVVESKELFRVAKLALDLGYQELGIALLEHLLEHLPGHAAAHCVVGEELVTVGRRAEAKEHFESVLEVDPSNLSALRGMGHIAQAEGSTGEGGEHLRLAYELYPYDVASRELFSETPDDLSELSLARLLTAAWLHEEALPFYQRALDRSSDGESDQPMITTLLLAEALWRTGRVQEARSLLETLTRQRPMWVRPKLILADIALGAREDALGASLLHDASALEPSLVIFRDLFGHDRRYESLMLDNLHVPAPGSELVDNAPVLVRYLLRVEPLPDPSTVEKEALGDEVSDGASEESTPKGAPVVATDEIPEEAPCPALSDEELESEESSSGPERGLPVRLIISSRDRLVAKYGDVGYQEVDAKLEKLCEVAARSTDHEVIKVYVDDQQCLAAYDVECEKGCDPLAIEQLIRHIGSQLSRQSKQIRSLLIIGGDSVIPFHRLVNPTDDEDDEILSDWPYAAQDGNPLLARFSVGRIPDGASADVEVLIGLVANAIRHHAARCKDSSPATSPTLLGRIMKVLGPKHGSTNSVGYSAEIWAEASRSVFESIGEVGSLMLSPPLTDYDFLSTHESIPALGYFNLHGFRGRPYWYGHGESEHGSQLLPVALTPLSVSWVDSEAAVIYTEACYGADLENEGPDGSIASNFLTSGAMGVIGSTAMSYGALAPPLSSADLLGKYVWQGIVAGLPIGCALSRARALFLREVATEQGYLDGEDQKTLLSFVLYGDPSLRLGQGLVSPDMDIEVEVSCPPLTCHARMLESESLPISRDLREKVQRSLPFHSTDGLKARPLLLCNGACANEKCTPNQGDTAAKVPGDFPELIVTSRQEAVSKGGNHLHHIVKVTVNGEGDVTKVLMSRGGTVVDKGSRQG